MRLTDSPQTPVPGLLPLLVAVVLSLSGCVQTAMLPANRMEPGQTVASLNAGGALLLPQFGVQATHGFGRGDLTANLSALPGPKFLAFGGGLAGRYYLPGDLTAEAQLQMTSFSGENVSSKRTAGLALIGLQTVPTDAGSWYYGAQVGVIRGPSPDVYFDDPDGRRSTGEVPIWTDPVVGGTLGYGPVEVGSSAQMQVELTANLPIWGAESEPPLPASGLSVGVFGLFQ